MPSATNVTSRVILVGMPVTSKGAIGVQMAGGSAFAIGVASSGAPAKGVCEYITSGKVSRSDWINITGTHRLSVGATYFLGQASGTLTTTQRAQIIGYAVSPTELIVQMSSVSIQTVTTAATVTVDTGPKGSLVWSGINDPTNGLGVVGDWYFKTSTREFFGPKGRFGWPAALGHLVS